MPTAALTLRVLLLLHWVLCGCVQAAAVAGDGLVLLRGPVGHRGAVAAGTGGGRVLLVDSRTIGQVCCLGLLVWG